MNKVRKLIDSCFRRNDRGKCKNDEVFKMSISYSILLVSTYNSKSLQIPFTLHILPLNNVYNNSAKFSTFYCPPINRAVTNKRNEVKDERITEAELSEGVGVVGIGVPVGVGDPVGGGVGGGVPVGV